MRFFYEDVMKGTVPETRTVDLRSAARDPAKGEMTAECAEIGRMLGSMIKSPKKFLTADL